MSIVNKIFSDEYDDEKIIDVVDVEKEDVYRAYRAKIQERVTELRYGAEVYLSEVELSEAIGKSRGYIQDVSSGRIFPSMSALIDICEHYGITLSEFFSDESLSPIRLKLKQQLNHLSEADIELLLQILERWK